MADIHYPSVSLLLHCDGINNDTAFTDSGPSPKTVTTIGNAKISTTQSKFGGSSAKFDGTGDYLTVGAIADFKHLHDDTTDYTIEGWVYWTGGAATIVSTTGSSSQIGANFAILVTTGYLDMAILRGASGNVLAATSTIGVTLNAWTYFKFTYTATTRAYTFRINDAAAGSGTMAVTGTWAASSTANPSNVLAVGRFQFTAPGNYLNGYLDDLRITKVLRTETTAPTEAFPNTDTETANAALTALSPADLESYGGGYAELAGPSPLIYAGVMGSATVALTAPSALAASFGGAHAPSLTAPRPTLIALGHDSTGEQAAYLTAPSPTLSITTGAHSRLTAPRQTLTATGTVTIWATADLEAPKPTLSSSGKVSGMANADLSITTTYSLIGYGGAVCSVSVTGSPTLLATGTTGSIGGATLTCPLFELTASGTAPNHGSANLIAPSPRLGQTAQAWLAAPSAQLTAIGSAVVTATYEAYAINLLEALDTNPRSNYEAKVPAATRYTNFPFTHVIRHQGSYYGANSTGLYLLEGTTDDGVAIPFAVKTCETDLDSPQHKTVESAYFAGRIGNAETVTLYAREETTHAMSFTTPRNTKPQSHRQVFPRGEKARYFAVGISGDKEFELDTIDLSVGTTKRRI